MSVTIGKKLGLLSTRAEWLQALLLLAWRPHLQQRVQGPLSRRALLRRPVRVTEASVAGGSSGAGGEARQANGRIKHMLLSVLQQQQGAGALWTQGGRGAGQRGKQGHGREPGQSSGTHTVSQM